MGFILRTLLWRINDDEYAMLHVSYWIGNQMEWNTIFCDLKT